LPRLWTHVHQAPDVAGRYGDHGGLHTVREQISVYCPAVWIRRTIAIGCENHC
jgi:hypothetical protein